MPWSSAELSATELDRLADDLPIIAYGNAAKSANVEAEWRESGAWGSGQDDSAVIGFGALAYDDDCLEDTYPAVDASPMHMIFDLDDVSFDTIAIVGGNWDSLTSLTEVSVEIADDEDFTTNAQIIATWTANFGRRLVSATLGAGLGDPNVTVAGRYSGVQYLRVRVEYAGSGDVPAFGELFLMTRAALPHRPNDPIDEESLESSWSETETDEGVIYRTIDYTGRLVLGAKWSPDSTTYENQFRTLFEGSAFGDDPVLWIPHPDTDVREAYVVRLDPSMSVVPVAGESRSVDVVLTEQKPFVSKEG